MISILFHILASKPQTDSILKLKSNLLSLFAVLLCTAILAGATFLYYPKYKQNWTEKTIGWDVSGYYMYLPAIFIYKDLRNVAFLDEIIKKYRPTPDPQQIMALPNGNKVMKYSAGQALQFLPFFAIAHWYALNSDHEADGFSLPYQFMISVEAIFMAFLGLFFLRLILLQFFNDKVTSVTILGVALGTNYFEYASMSGAMTHNNLFTLYAIILYLTISFYEKPGYFKAIGIGLLVGLAALTRPTEIMTALIPVLWGVSFPLKKGMKDRYGFIREHIWYFILMAVATLAVGSIQMIYWKYVSGNLLVYSYGEKQTFSWLSPHLMDGLFSYRSGWLLYSPLLILSILGFWYLRKKVPQIFLAILAIMIPFTYITFAWDNWWYGGSIGSRAMVQSYALLAFPFAALLDNWWNRKWRKDILYFFIPLCIYYNLWLTHQAHRGGKYFVGQMTNAYFWKVLGTYEKNENDLKLLDTNEEFRGKRQDVKVLFKTGFEDDKDLQTCPFPAINGNKSLCVDQERPFSRLFQANAEPGTFKWLRGQATFKCPSREWDKWRMAQLIVSYHLDKEVVKRKFFRLHRILKSGDQKTLYLDVKAPDKPFNKVGVQIWNGGGPKQLILDDLRIEVFDTY